MAKIKYYAVAVGLKSGIYTTWVECEKQVKGFSGAKYQSFSTLAEAEAYLGVTPSAEIKTTATDEPTINAQVFAFVDGSYNNQTNTFGYGGFIQLGAEKIIIQGSGADIYESSNVSGEVKGSMNAIEKAIELNLPELDIYYDYNGIELWATREWKANKQISKEYVNFIDSVKSKIKINFIKVKAHTGIDGNELADTLAKQACGVE